MRKCRKCLALAPKHIYDNLSELNFEWNDYPQYWEEWETPLKPMMDETVCKKCLLEHFELWDVVPEPDMRGFNCTFDTDTWQWVVPYGDNKVPLNDIDENNNFIKNNFHYNVNPYTIYDGGIEHLNMAIKGEPFLKEVALCSL